MSDVLKLKRLILAALVAGAPMTVEARETIVGTWRLENGQCTPADGAIAIAPMSLTMDAYSCSFHDVVRKGDVVTWHGACGSGGEQAAMAVVVARLVGARLSIMENGRYHDAAYVRCKLGEDVSSAVPERSSSRTALAADIGSYEGDFVSGCLPKVSCAVSIRKIDSNRYLFDWKATDRMDGTTYCRHRATMVVGTGRHEDETISNVLHGKLVETGDEVIASPVGGGRTWLYLNGNVCQTAAIHSGHIVMNGIYSRRD